MQPQDQSQSTTWCTKNCSKEKMCNVTVNCKYYAWRSLTTYSFYWACCMTQGWGQLHVWLQSIVLDYRFLCFRNHNHHCDLPVIVIIIDEKSWLYMYIQMYMYITSKFCIIHVYIIYTMYMYIQCTCSMYMYCTSVIGIKKIHIQCTCT